MKEINFYFPLSIVYDGDYNYVGNMFAAKHYQEEILTAQVQSIILKHWEAFWIKKILMKAAVSTAVHMV